ncbi:MAG: hypothetical protein HYU87_00770 [Chloroflexi bacterium]|nr:hypothetical protein [Chloroflexota bacterium]
MKPPGAPKLVPLIEAVGARSEEAREVLDSHGLRALGGMATHEVFATGEGRRFREIAKTMFREDVIVNEAVLA